jgi:hypothetical protein
MSVESLWPRIRVCGASSNASRMFSSIKTGRNRRTLVCRGAADPNAFGDGPFRPALIRSPIRPLSSFLRRLPDRSQTSTQSRNTSLRSATLKPASVSSPRTLFQLRSVNGCSFAEKAPAARVERKPSAPTERKMRIACLSFSVGVLRKISSNSPLL